jgi:outer membrane protein
MVMGNKTRTAVVVLVWSIALAALTAGDGVAQEFRIAYITSWKIIGPEATFQPSRDAQSALQRDIESWNRELQDLQNAILEQEQEIQRQRLVMTESQLREKEQEVFQKKAEFERRTREIWDQGGLIERRNQELMQPIYEKMVEAIERVAQEQGYAFVFEASDGNLVWADRSYDITEDVLQVLGELMDVPVGGTSP